MTRSALVLPQLERLLASGTPTPASLRRSRTRLLASGGMIRTLGVTADCSVLRENSEFDLPSFQPHTTTARGRESGRIESVALPVAAAPLRRLLENHVAKHEQTKSWGFLNSFSGWWRERGGNHQFVDFRHRFICERLDSVRTAHLVQHRLRRP
jgi:hypothetical protein